MLQKIKETVESGGTVVPEPEPPITEEYPAWEPYNGIPPVPYQVGSKVTHNAVSYTHLDVYKRQRLQRVLYRGHAAYWYHGYHRQ